MEFFTLITAIIGCLGTLVNFVLYFWNKRISIKMDIHELKCWPDKGALLYVSFINQSEVPVTIGNVSLLQKESKLFMTFVPTVVLTTTHSQSGQLVSKEETYNLSFPVNLLPHSGQSGYIHFQSNPNSEIILGQVLNFEIYTNRRKKILISIPQSAIHQR